MKILMINVVCGIRSTGRICTDLATALEAEGHEVKIAYGRENVPKQYQKYAIRIGTNLGTKLHGVEARLNDAAGFGSRLATRAFIRWVKEYDPDIIYLHNLHGYYINIEILFDYLKTCGKQIIWTLHDCWAFTGHCTHFTVAGCNQWKTKCQKCCQKGEYPKSILLDRCADNFQRKKAAFTGVSGMKLITPSHWLADLVKQSYLKEYPVEVVYNSVDENVFRPTSSDFRQRYGLVEKRIVLGVANVWDERKGLDDFYSLSEILDDRYKIVLVGQIQNKKKIPKNILVLPRTNSTRELAEIYTAADVFVNPSKEETFGLTSYEASLCGTSVIVYRGTACEEIADLYNGIAVDQNVASLRDAIYEIFNR